VDRAPGFFISGSQFVFSLTDESTKRVVVFAALAAVVMSSLGADAMWVKRSDAELIDKMRE